METLDQPAYSPDLNPIENIWSWLKLKVSGDMPKNIAELKTSIRKWWKTITPDMLRPYIEGMESRFIDVVSKKGGYINK